MKNITIKKTLTSKNTILSFLVLLGLGIINPIFSSKIQWVYPDRPMVSDIFITLIQEIPWLKYISALAMLILIGIFIIYFFNYKRRNVPYAFYSITIVYLLRGLLMLLTPMGRPTGNLASYGILEVFDVKQHGMFPSGHIALSSIIFLLIDKKDSQSLKTAAGVLLILQTIFLIISRGHYSIDIVGGFMTAYFVFIFMEKRKEQIWCNI